MSAPIVGTLSYQVVEVVKGSPRSVEEEWIKINLPQGGQGFVSRQFFGTPVDYRAHFSKESGSWRMTVFVRGD